MNIEALKELDSFNCTEQYWKQPIFTRVVYSDGVKFLIENADCFWLFTEIASAQHLPVIRNDAALQLMQFWTLKPAENNGAILICERDSDDIAFQKQIEFTDFPFKATGGQMRIWVAPTFVDGMKKMVLFLPSEY